MERMQPGHLLVSFRNCLLQIPLLTHEWAQAIAQDRKGSAHRCRVECEALRRFQAIDASATLADVYPYINRRILLPRWQEGGCKRMRMPDSGQLINPSKVNASPPPQPIVGGACPSFCQRRHARFPHSGSKGGAG